jgi:hypothetical protein
VFSHLARTAAAATALASCLATVVLAGTAAAAAPGRITKGDVRALFEARTTANQLHLANGLLTSAPTTAFERGRINPFGTGQELCDRDWLILLASFGIGHTPGSMAAVRATTTIAFSVDGSSVSTVATATKRFLTGDPKTAFFGWSVAHFYAPGSLEDGVHLLETTITSTDGVEVIDTSFTIDGAACG